MITVRRSEDRGAANFGWLDSKHTFSFGSYMDPNHMGFGPLRVINEDRVKPGTGFDTHGHRDMEIISYVLEGALEHKDSIGTGSVIRPGEVQRMSAGSGIRHSEYNHSQEDPVHFLQIWIIPDEDGIEPGYEQKAFADEEKRGRFRLVASPDGSDGSVKLHQDVRLFAGLFDKDEMASLQVDSNRYVWVQIARGEVIVNGTPLSAGDGLALRDVTSVDVTGVNDAEVLVFDMTA